jgi:hypothetical protein
VCPWVNFGLSAAIVSEHNAVLGRAKHYYFSSRTKTPKKREKHAEKEKPDVEGVMSLTSSVDPDKPVDDREVSDTIE